MEYRYVQSHSYQRLYDYSVHVNYNCIKSYINAIQKIDKLDVPTFR